MPTVETVCAQCPNHGLCEEPCDYWYTVLDAQYLLPQSPPETA